MGELRGKIVKLKYFSGNRVEYREFSEGKILFITGIFRGEPFDHHEILQLSEKKVDCREFSGKTVDHREFTE